MNRSGLETLSFSKAAGRARSPDGAQRNPDQWASWQHQKPLPAVPAHYATIPVFCPTAQLSFGFAEALKSLAISTVHGVVFDIFV
ncbi:hypothetical protein [Bradyrhizobium sp. CCGB01]|uniref:hypothetical protein n=1 Tax=Bradyrhizobium sp. CCGB01 TaxID=2949634 RepID=UPI0020B25663|nr:hypothetical protein [Bradyrhizobium sp. CCGB01]MCP3408761.1 hypothetical protein [Bradyrhizobium sp. CCGB01]